MPHLGLKRNLAKVWPSQPRDRTVVLMYHSVGDTLWGMPKQRFHDQINWLGDHCHVLSLTDLINNPSDNNGLRVAITFDDGYVSLYNTVLTILSQKKMNAMVYLNTGWIGDDENQRRRSDAKLGHYPEELFLTWEEVYELHRTGWEIGSHGVNHYNFARIERDIAQQELLNSKQDVEMRLNTDCPHFSYPWGQYTSQLKNDVRSVGYKYAVAARHAKIKHSSDLFALPRINISRDYSLDDFKDIVMGKWDYLGVIHKIKGL
jgi:peptidoglycan/xylan/chitin deacetylase (PgdA/CDA1 family)